MIDERSVLRGVSALQTLSIFAALFTAAMARWLRCVGRSGSYAGRFSTINTTAMIGDTVATNPQISH